MSTQSVLQIKIVTIEDSPIVANRLRSILSDIDFVEWSGNATNNEDALALITGQQPDIALAPHTVGGVIQAGEPIMLVGHSQGGMIAARLATQLRSAEFTVTHLVTAGAPVGLAAVPRSVSVLSLQNQGDVVPELDGADNPRRANWITVGTAHGGSSVLAKHSVRSYLAGAVDVDASADPALAHWRRTAAGFFSADQVSTQVFQVRRGD